MPAALRAAALSLRPAHAQACMPAPEPRALAPGRARKQTDRFAANSVRPTLPVASTRLSALPKTQI